MSNGFIIILRDSQELFLKDKQVHDFMMLVAYRARWKETTINADGTRLGEAYVGRDDVFKIFGWGERTYINVKKRVEQKYKFATCKGSNQGTIVKLLDNRFCDLKLPFDEEQRVEQKVECKKDTKVEQGSSKGRARGYLTKNKKEERRREDSDISKDISSSSPPYPQRGTRQSRGEGGKRKDGYKYPGEISRDAFDLKQKAHDLCVLISVDKIQFAIDELDGSVELVCKAIETMGASIAKGFAFFAPTSVFANIVSELKSTPKNEIVLREKDNRRKATDFKNNIHLEKGQKLILGKDLLEAHIGNNAHQLFFASPTFSFELDCIKKLLSKKVG